MKDELMTSLESLLEQAVSSFPYPPTPDLAPGVMAQLAPRAAGSAFSRRRLALTAAVVLVVLAGLMAVPQVRAAVLEVLRIGAVRIFLEEPTPPSPPQAAVTATSLPQAATAAPPTATPWTVGLGDETTLVDAAAQVRFAIRLPAYPDDAGVPDQVFTSNTDGPVVVLVWLQPDDASRLRFALYEIGPGAFLGKGQPQTIQETQVNKQRALWLTGRHEYYDLTRGSGAARIVNSNVLVWDEDGITYRLETWLDMDEAVRIASSLQPVPVGE